MAKVSSVYASCRTYSDEGLTETTDGPSGRHSYFRTSFVRPGPFKFQVWFNATEPGRVNPFVVWSNGDLVQLQGIRAAGGVQHQRLDTVLGGLQEYCEGGSVTVPQLLLPVAFRNLELLSVMVDARVTSEETIDGRPAFRIEGTVTRLPVKVWIDKTQYLVLKVYRRVNAVNGEVESTVQYKPKLNGEIPPGDLTQPPSPNPDPSDSTSQVRTPSDLGPPPKLRVFGSSLSQGEQENKVQRAADEDVVRVDTDLVICPVLVLDAQGKTVRGLTATDFIVKEDGKPQEVTSLALGTDKDVPRSIVLVIDYSTSQLPYIKTSIESAKLLVDKLNPKDKMAVVTDDLYLLVDFTTNKELLKTRLEGLKTSALAGNIGQSHQYDALYASLNELFNNEDTRPIVIFQTDGDQLEMLNGNSEKQLLYWQPRKYGLEDIMAATEKSRAAVYSVISGIRFVDVPPGDLARRARVDQEIRQSTHFESRQLRGLPRPMPNPPDDKFFDRYAQQWQRRQMALMRVAKFTGTTPEFLEEPGQADEIYNRILHDIERRYVIGYYPTNRARDGKRRKVTIEVRNHPDYQVEGQKSYFPRGK